MTFPIRCGTCGKDMNVDGQWLLCREHFVKDIQLLKEALAFASSVIKSGEPWTDACEQVIGGAMLGSLKLKKCPECKGAGTVDIERGGACVECNTCDGTGRIKNE